MPDYDEIDRTIAELNNPHLTIEEVEKRVQWLSGQSFGDNPRGLQYQNRVQHAVDLGRRRIESGRREEKETRRDQESKDAEEKAEKKRLRRQDVAIVITVVFGLISAVGLIYNTFFAKSRHANTGATPPPTYRQTPAPTAAPIEPANSAKPSPQQTATARPSVNPPESSD